MNKSRTRFLALTVAAIVTMDAAGNPVHADDSVLIERPWRSFAASLSSPTGEELTPYRLVLRVIDDVSNTELDGEYELPPQFLTDPLALFVKEVRFPDGHYRIYVHDGTLGRSRLILDVWIEQGRIVPPNSNERRGQRPPGSKVNGAFNHKAIPFETWYAAAAQSRTVPDTRDSGHRPPANWQEADDYLRRISQIEPRERFRAWSLLLKEHENVDLHRVAAPLSSSHTMWIPPGLLVEIALQGRQQAVGGLRSVFERDLAIWQAVRSLSVIGGRGGETHTEALARYRVFHSAAELAGGGGQPAWIGEMPRIEPASYQDGTEDFYRHQAQLALQQSIESVEGMLGNADPSQQSRLWSLLTHRHRLLADLVTGFTRAADDTGGVRDDILRNSVTVHAHVWRVIDAWDRSGRRGGELDRVAAARRDWQMAVATEAIYHDNKGAASDALASAIDAGTLHIEALQEMARDAGRSERSTLMSRLTTASARLTLARIAQAELDGNRGAEIEALEDHDGILSWETQFVEELFKEGRRGGELERLAALHCRHGLVWAELRQLREGSR